MKSFKSYQYLRLLTSDDIIANGDYILKDLTVRIKQGYLCDSMDEEQKNLPAVESHDGTHIEHWKDGKLHSENTPAIIDISEKYDEWWLNGKKIHPGNTIING